MQIIHAEFRDGVTRMCICTILYWMYDDDEEEWPAASTSPDIAADPE